MRIYADTNVYARPFDDYSQPRIFLEGEAALLFFDAVKQKKFILLSSDILRFEIERSPNPKRLQMKSFLALPSQHVVQSSRVFNLAKEISEKCGIDPRDALHLASAEVGKAHYVLSCDDLLIRKLPCLQEHFILRVINPTDFIQSIHL